MRDYLVALWFYVCVMCVCVCVSHLVIHQVLCAITWLTVIHQFLCMHDYLVALRSARFYVCMIVLCCRINAPASLCEGSRVAYLLPLATQYVGFRVMQG